MGGSFTVGTEEEPFLQQAQITLHGSPVSKELPLYGAKVLACRRCTMDLHGRPTIPIWTSLNHTVNPGAKEICLSQPVDWDLGSQFVITSSGFDMNEIEQRTMVSLTQGGRCVSFDTPLQHQHLGETSALLELASTLVSVDACPHTCPRCGWPEHWPPSLPHPYLPPVLLNLPQPPSAPLPRAATFVCPQVRRASTVGSRPNFERRWDCSRATSWCRGTTCRQSTGTAAPSCSTRRMANAVTTRLWGGSVISRCGTWARHSSWVDTRFTVSCADSNLASSTVPHSMLSIQRATRPGVLTVHMSGTIDQSYVRRCSIHHTYNRAIAFHGVHKLRAQVQTSMAT